MPRPGQGAGPSPRIPPRYRALVMSAAGATGIPPKIVATQIDDESSWNPRAVSPTGAMGIAQFEPATWQVWGSGSPDNPRDAFRAYARYMSALLGQYHGDIRQALAAYNAGPGNINAGYPYADLIIQNAGYGESVHAQSYANPLRNVKGLKAERVDMGVDYAGQPGSPIYALGPGVITESGFNWRGAVGAPVPGTWITERLTAGPLTGQQIYVAEDITPAVTTGQHVTAGTILGHLTGGGGIETGFAAKGALGQSGETMAAATGQAATGGDPGAVSTGWGVAYSDILHATGAPAGIVGQRSGSTPSWLQTVLEGLKIGFLGSPIGGGGGPAGPHGGGLGGIATAIEDVATGLADVGKLIDFLLNPSHIIRIAAGLGGGGLMISGLWMLSHTGTRPAALPMGIALVGAGGVGLFVAFHNLPADVSDFGSLLGYLRSSAGRASAAEKVAAGRP